MQISRTKWIQQSSWASNPHKKHQILQETNLVFIILLELVNKKNLEMTNGIICAFFLGGSWHIGYIFKEFFK
jgi:hypothetical protein